MNWGKLKTPLLYFSLGVNFAFLIVLGFFYLSHSGEGHERHQEDGERQTERHQQAKEDRKPGRYFYKHKIGVSGNRWSKLRPEMESFHENSYEICKKIQNLHNKLLRLVQNSPGNEEAIETVKKRMRTLREEKQQLFVQYLNRQKQHLTNSQQRDVFKALQKKRNCEKHTHFLEEKSHHQTEEHH